MFLAKMEAFLIVIPKVSKVRHVFELILALHFIFRISSPAIFQVPTSFRMSVISPIFWVIRFEGSFINNFGPKKVIGVAGIEPGSAAGACSKSGCHVQMH